MINDSFRAEWPNILNVKIINFKIFVRSLLKNKSESLIKYQLIILMVCGLATCASIASFPF